MLSSPRIHVYDVLSYTSEDEVYKAENVKKGVHPWLCSKNDKSGRLEGEFVLCQPSLIFTIHVGNYKSHTIEILVGHSTKSKTRPTKYKTYLPTFTMFSPGIPGNYPEKHFQFTKDHFVKSLFKKKWDRIKIILTQPAKKSQFGLRVFLMNEERGPPSDYTSFYNLCLEIENEEDDKFEKIQKRQDMYLQGGGSSRTTPMSYFCSSLSPFPRTSLVSCCRTISKNRKDASSDFKAEARKFLKKKRSPFFFSRFNDYYDEFEFQRDNPLTLEEKHIFYDLYVKLVGESQWDDKEKIFATVEEDYHDDIFEGLIPKQSATDASCSKESIGAIKSATITMASPLINSSAKKSCPSKRCDAQANGSNTGGNIHSTKSKRITRNLRANSFQQK